MDGGNVCSKEFFREVLRAVWMDNTPDEVLALWRARVAGGGSFPGDALRCLEAVLQDPPEDLIALMQEHGWIHLVHEEDGEEWPFTFEEYVAWLRAEKDRLRAVYESPTP